MANGDTARAKKAQAKNRSRIVVETPGVKDSSRDEAIRKRGGLYGDRIKYEPYIQMGPTFRPKDKVKRG